MDLKLLDEDCGFDGSSEGRCVLGFCEGLREGLGDIFGLGASVLSGGEGGCMTLAYSIKKLY